MNDSSEELEPAAAAAGADADLQRVPEAPTPAAEPQSPESATDASWDAAMQSLRDRFPKATEAILFSVFKLQQNPELSMRDFRDEANLHGITLGGRAFHSAKVLLGLAEPSVRKPRQPNPSHTTATLAPDRVGASRPGNDVESSLIQAVQQIQDAATADSRRLRDAMRRAVDVLQRALDGRPD